MTPRQLWQRMKARIQVDRREDLRAGLVAWSVWKAQHGRKVDVDPEDFCLGPRENRLRTEEEQKLALEAFLMPFHLQREQENGKTDP